MRQLTVKVTKHKATRILFTLLFIGFLVSLAGTTRTQQSANATATVAGWNWVLKPGVVATFEFDFEAFGIGAIARPVEVVKVEAISKVWR